MAKNVVLSVVLLLCLSSVMSVTHFADNTAAYPQTICPTTSAKALSATSLVANTPVLTASGSIPQIDDVSYVQDSSLDDVIEIRVAITGTTGSYTITFTSTISTLATPKVSTAASTSAALPIIKKFLKNVLVTQEGSTYRAYVVDVSTDVAAMSSIVTLSIPVTAYSTANSITQFRVLSVSSDANPVVSCYVEGGMIGGTYADFIDYTITPSVPSRTNQKTNTAYGVLGSKVVLKTNLIGLPQLFLDRTTGVSQYVVFGVTGTYVQLSSTAAPTFTLATDQVYFYRLNGGWNYLLIINHATKRDATIILGEKSAVIAGSGSLSTTTSTAVIKYYSDNIQNVLVVTDQGLAWTNTHNAAAPPVTAFIVQSSGFTGNDLKIYTTNSISLSGDKAFALYSAEIVVFQLVSSTVVNLYKTITFSGANVPGATAAMDVKFTIHCQCSLVKVKRFTCFSTSLSCLATADTIWSSANC